VQKAAIPSVLDTLRQGKEARWDEQLSHRNQCIENRGKLSTFSLNDTALTFGRLSAAFKILSYVTKKDACFWGRILRSCL